MNGMQGRNAYKKSEAHAQIHPVKLIHLMYERVLTHLELAGQGVQQKNAKIRGENLSKAIAIITELNASIKESDDSEPAAFLRGLYSAILVELPKVSISNDGEILRQATRYMTRLKEIWEETALPEAGFAATKSKVHPKESSSESLESQGRGYSTSAPQGLSVSI